MSSYEPAPLRSEEWRAILRLVRECREIGDCRRLWRQHFLAELSRWIDVDLAYCGELTGPDDLASTDLGMIVSPAQRRIEQPESDVRPNVNSDDTGSLAFVFDSLRNVLQHDREGGADLDAGAEETRYRAQVCRRIHDSGARGPILWCFESIPEATAALTSGVMVCRESGKSDYTAFERALVREAHAAVPPLIGGPLARLSDPSPLDLTPRTKQVLDCLLLGESDKQIASRLKLSTFTVNQYNKLIFRHFGASSRSGLLACWVQRARGNRTSSGR